MTAMQNKKNVSHVLRTLIRKLSPSLKEKSGVYFLKNLLGSTWPNNNQLRKTTYEGSYNRPGSRQWLPEPRTVGMERRVAFRNLGV